MFASQTYETRRDRLRARLGTGLVLLLGNEGPPAGPMFRQESTFLYFTGVDRPGFALLMDLDQGSATLYGDDPPPEAALWSGPLPGVGELASLSGLASAAPGAKLADRVKAALGQGRVIRFLPPTRPEHQLRLFLSFGFHPEHQALAASSDLVQAVVEQRACKSQEELAELERAADLSADMHLAAMRLARPGMTEAELAARMAEIALASGAELSQTIVATIHGEILRNPRHDLGLESGRMVLVQAGARSTRHYAGDLSSAFPVDRTFSARQKEVYQIVLHALQDTAAALKPGIRFQEAHLRACRSLVEGLQALGLMKGNADEAVACGAHGLFFPHGLGHMLGLDVEDMGDLGEAWAGYEGGPRPAQGPKPQHLVRELTPGSVFTLEPGLYLIPERMDRWRADQRFADFIDYPRLEPYRGFGGIRIGENYAMMEHGVRRLGKALPRIPGEIEVVRGRS